MANIRTRVEFPVRSFRKPRFRTLMWRKSGRSPFVHLLHCVLQCSINCIHDYLRKQTFCEVLLISSPALHCVPASGSRCRESAMPALPVLSPRNDPFVLRACLVAASRYRVRPAGEHSGGWMARARTGGLGVFVPLTIDGDFHGHEEKSQEENIQEKSVVAGTKSREERSCQEEVRRNNGVEEEASKKMAWKPGGKPFRCDESRNSLVFPTGSRP